MRSTHVCLGGVRAAGAIGVLALAGSTASADIVASFGFTDLQANFMLDDGTGNGMFTADGTLASSGDVTRLLATGGTTLYSPGDIDDAPTSVHFEISVFNIDSVEKTAEGVGSFSISDADGDVLMGTFSGDWSGAGFGFTFYGGSGVDFEFDSSAGNGTWDGPAGGSFSTDFGVDQLIGAVSLLFQQPNTEFFSESFFETSAQADGIMIIPAPGALALGGIGLGLASVRRRR